MTSFARTVGVIRSESGASLLELALVLPVLALMLVALVDFGRGVAIEMALESGARAGAEYGALFPQDPVGVGTAIADAIGAGITPGSISNVQQCRCLGAVVGDCSAPCNGGGSEMYSLITVNFDYQPLLPYPGIGSSIPLKGTATFRVR